MNQVIDIIDKEQQKGDLTPFSVGDTVRVHTRVVEGDKERIQIFAGVVIGRKGRGLNETFTVRRISYGEGVERVFPLHSPRIAKVEVEQQGRVRRAKLNYLRTVVGRRRTDRAKLYAVSLESIRGSQNGAGGSRATWTGRSHDRGSGSEPVKRPTIFSGLITCHLSLAQICQ